MSASVSRDHGHPLLSATIEYEFPGKWLLVTVMTSKEGNASTLVGFHVDRIPDSLENLNKFTLYGKGISQYSILLLAVFSLIFAMPSSGQSPKALKWLWVPFILTGFGRFAANWATGAWKFTLWRFEIPCGMAHHTVYEPWIVNASIPVLLSSS